MKIYTDKFGNTLHKKFIHSRGITQYYAKNVEGKLVNPSGFNRLSKEAGLRIQKVTHSGIQVRRRLI